MTATAVAALVVFVATYAIIAWDRFNRAVVALIGAAAMVVVGAVRAPQVFFTEGSGVDWNVIFLLYGMMIIVGILRETGVFEFAAIWAAQRSGARPFRMMVLLVLMTALASALLDNVTTVLLVVPVTLLLCERLALPPLPFLLAEVMASNIGGTATLIGDPPNIVIASRAGLTFNDFLLHLAPVAIVMLLSYLGLCWLLWGRSLRYDPKRAKALMSLQRKESITDSRLLRRTGLVLVVVLAGFATHSITHIEPSLIALLGAGAAALLSGMPVAAFHRDVEWETLVFFAGLFVMVGALVHQGVIAEVAAAVTGPLGENYAVGAQAVLLGSGVLSGIVDNIPYVASMAPLVSALVGPAQDPGAPSAGLWWALALGAGLGGNATAIGASANVVMTGIARRYGHPISFWEFTKYGVPITAVTLLIASGYLWLRYA